MMKKIILALAFSGAFISNPLFADPPVDPTVDLASHAKVNDPILFKLYMENDSPFFKPNNSTDRWYTNGTAINIAHRPQWAEDLAEPMDELLTFLVPFADEFGPAKTAAGYTFGQLMFTPRDIDRTDLIEDDRPYAGYLYAGVFWQRMSDNNNDNENNQGNGKGYATLDHFQIDLGLTGPASLADESQKWIHEIFDSDEPMGWDNQIGDELTFQFYFRKKWRFDFDGTENQDRFKFQVIPQLGLALGTVYRHVDAGVVLRYGWNLPDDFGPGRLADLEAPIGDRSTGWNAYTFLRLTGRVVEHNMFLKGNNFKSSHSVDEETLLGEFQVGANVAYNTEDWIFELGYSQTYQTEEFKLQTGTHAFGAWTIAATRWF